MIPSQVKIKNKVVYDVAFIDEFKDKQQLGECRFNERLILIKRGQSEKQTIKTLTHELIHSLCFERGIDISHRAIYQLEDAIFYILFHNDWSDKNGK